MKKNYFLRTAILLVALLSGANTGWAVSLTQDVVFNDWSKLTKNGSGGYAAYKGDQTFPGSDGVDYTWTFVADVMAENSSATAKRLQMKKSSGQLDSPTFETEQGFSITVTYESSANISITEKGTNNTVTGASPLMLEVSSLSAGISIKAGSATTYITQIEVTPTGGTSLQDPALAFTGITGDVTKQLSEGSYSSAATSASDAAIVYSSSNTNIATIDQKGLVTLVAGGGSTVIKAEVAETDKYYSSAIQYTLTVIDLSKAKTFNKVTDGIVTKGTYLITYQASDDATSVMAMNATNEKDYFLNTEFDITEGQITTDNQSVMWEIAQQSDGNYSISNGTIFAGYKDSGNNAYVYDSYNSDECGWKISYDNTTNLFKIQSATATEKDRYLQYNTGSPRFACYTGGQKDITLYKMEDNSGITTTEVNSMKIINGKGQVTVVTDKPESVAIYNLAGAQVRQIELVEGNNIIDLPAGIYVIGHQKVVVF